MSEYKEFWIQASNMIVHDDKPPIVKPCFHVIEFSAFEKLQKDWEEAATQNYADKCEIEKLKKQNEIMREALEFYADIDSWDCPTGLYDVTAIVDDESTNYYSDVAGDFDDVGGKRARQALKDVEGDG